MNNAAPISSEPAQGLHTGSDAQARLRKRYAAERRFKFFGIGAIILSILALALLLVSIVGSGYTAFWQARITLPIQFDAQLIDPSGTRDEAALRSGDYMGLIRQSATQLFPEATGRQEQREMMALFSSGAGDVLRDMVLDNPDIIGTTQTVSLIAGTDVDMYLKGNLPRDLPEDQRRLSERQFQWIDTLRSQDRLDTAFNATFFTGADSREPELAGVLGGLVGSFLTLLITLLLAFPAGVAAAIYLEEFAPKNRFSDFIEVNINNLAAVPSIIYGLLGLAIFMNAFGLPRSAPVVGGMVLAIMSLPIIIIASRAALRAVPPSIREAALGLGASKMQVVLHHVLPLAMPGMLTGSILAMAHALGETAPLLMIGMVAFVADIPSGFTDAATVLPVQIFMWADSPERGFVEKTSAGIIVLLLFLLFMNALAVLLRKKFERRW